RPERITTSRLSPAFFRVLLGREVPTVIVSGDTAPERIAEVRRSGFEILHKPVPPAVFRESITQMLACTPELRKS
ncbi:hypothetical protein ACFPL5_02715, partial [Azospirillum rugosum]